MALYHIIEQKLEGGKEVAETILQEKVTEPQKMLMIDPAVFTSSHRDSSFHSSPNYSPTTQQHPTELLDHYSHWPCNLTSHYSTSLYPPVIPTPHQFPTTEYRRQHHRNRRVEIHRSHVTNEDSLFPPTSFAIKCKDRITLEGETKKIRKKFSILLFTVLNTLRDANPHKVITKLSCYDKRYSTLTKQRANMEDVIRVLTMNVSFLDYDLLLVILDDDISARHWSGYGMFRNAHSMVESYSHTLSQYLQNRLYAHHKNPNKLKLPVDRQMEISASDIRQKEQLKFIAESTTKKEIELEEFSESHDESTDSEADPTELRGVEVLEETTVTVAQTAQLFDWKGYGLKLQIPKNSLPESVKSCTITIKASLAGQYQFPPNTELVSPVFWLRCEPQCRFNAPLTLSIQHCALPRNSLRLFIARAQCTQKDLPYLFKVLHGGTFSEHSSYGVIELNRFSGVAVIQERSDERRYWSSVFYMGPPNNRKIHFTVTWHEDAHITTVIKKYSQRKATIGPEQSITFKDTTVALDIPKGGLILQEKWKVFPVTPPKIAKREVDSHKPEHQRTVPHCELVAKWITQDKQIQPLEHTVDILGTEEEEKYFTINIDPGQEAQESEAIETENTSKSPLQMQHLHAIKECLKDLSQDKIIEVGLALGLLYPNLRKMTMLPEDMIQAWLEKRDKVLSFSGEPTMQSLITALESSGLAGTVDIVRSKFIT